VNPPAPRFAPVDRQTLSQGIRLAILESLRRGELRPGTRLPSERELSEQFGVARTSVREAFQGLVTLGVIEKRGNASYVADSVPTYPLELEDLRKRKVTELFEVRQVVEVPIVRLATCRASEAQRAEVAAIALRFSDDMPFDEFQRLDREFHWTIAQTCGNETLADFYRTVLDSIFASREVADLLHAIENEAVVREVVRKSTVAHREIAQAIVGGDWAAGIDAAERHLDAVEEDIIARMV
jgi:GntR family transcriptional repressor for pyruvate dehydrogenase complex